MPAITGIINAVKSVCGVTTTTSEENTDLCESHHTQGFKGWVAIGNSFNRSALLLTSSGIAANAVEKVSVKTMEEKVFSNIHLQRRNNFVSLSTVTKSIRIKKYTYYYKTKPTISSDCMCW